MVRQGGSLDAPLLRHRQASDHRHGDYEQLEIHLRSIMKYLMTCFWAALN